MAGSYASALVIKNKAIKCRATCHNPQENHDRSKCCWLYPHLWLNHSAPLPEASANPPKMLSAHLAYMFAMVLSPILNCHQVFLDSRALNCMLNNPNFFPHLQPNETEIQTSNPEAPISSLGKETALLTTTLASLYLQNSLYVPNLAINLVSLGQFIQKGCSLILLTPNHFAILFKGKQIMSGVIDDNLFFINKGFNLPAISFSFISLSTIHKHFCHPHLEKTCLLSK